MEDKLLLGLLYLDRKFTSPYQLEEFLPHIELVLKLANRRKEFSKEEIYLLRKLLYKLDRFREFIEKYPQLLAAKFKLEGRL